MTAVVERAERTGKRVSPLIVPTNNPLYAVLRTANDLKAQEVIQYVANRLDLNIQNERQSNAASWREQALSDCGWDAGAARSS